MEIKKEKQWGIIIVLVMFTIQFGNGLIQVWLVSDEELGVLVKLLMFVLCCIVVFFTISGLYWQLKGSIILEVDEKGILSVDKKGKVFSPKRYYEINKIPEIRVYKDYNATHPTNELIAQAKILNFAKIYFIYDREEVILYKGKSVPLAESILEEIKAFIIEKT